MKSLSYFSLIPLSFHKFFKSSYIFIAQTNCHHTHTHTRIYRRVCGVFVCVYWTRLTFCPGLDINCTVTLYCAAVSTASAQHEDEEEKASKMKQSWQTDELSGARFIQSLSRLEWMTKHGCPRTTTTTTSPPSRATATTTQLNTLQKNKLTADDDLSETGFYPFIHTHNVQRSLRRYNQPLAPCPAPVQCVQCADNQQGGRAMRTHVLPSVDGHRLNFSCPSSLHFAPLSLPWLLLVLLLFFLLLLLLLHTVTLGIMIFQSSENNF